MAPGLQRGHRVRRPVLPDRLRDLQHVRPSQRRVRPGLPPGRKSPGHGPQVPSQAGRNVPLRAARHGLRPAFVRKDQPPSQPGRKDPWRAARPGLFRGCVPAGQTGLAPVTVPVGRLMCARRLPGLRAIAHRIIVRRTGGRQAGALRTSGRPTSGRHILSGVGITGIRAGAGISQQLLPVERSPMSSICLTPIPVTRSSSTARRCISVTASCIDRQCIATNACTKSFPRKRTRELAEASPACFSSPRQECVVKRCAKCRRRL